MNREILFRGKSERSGEWVYGSLIVTHGGCVIYSKYHPLVTAPPEKKGDYLNQYVVDPRTVGQYTGLTDKNGKKIFEGDVVKQFPRASWGDFSRVEIGKVFWEENTLQWKRTGKDINGEKFMTFCMAKDCVYEVIGNIHDNPELLEVKE